MAHAAVRTALVYSDAWTRFDYGPEHPLRMERLGLTWRLMQACGLTTLPDAVVRAPEPAAEQEIAIYHDAEYLAMLKACNSGRAPQLAARFGLGPGDNPVFPGLWDAARLCAAGSLLAADLVADGRADRAFHFAGGLHHAMPSRASGFCYVNDAVLAILRLRAPGLGGAREAHDGPPAEARVPGRRRQRPAERRAGVDGGVGRAEGRRAAVGAPGLVRRGRAAQPLRGGLDVGPARAASRASARPRPGVRAAAGRRDPPDDLPAAQAVDREPRRGFNRSIVVAKGAFGRG